MPLEKRRVSSALEGGATAPAEEKRVLEALEAWLKHGRSLRKVSMHFDVYLEGYRWSVTLTKHGIETGSTEGRGALLCCAIKDALGREGAL